ncbi:MAG TPA: hypothetical protein VIY47_04800 [Ignavibacteriaceae bacterium]
MNTDEIIDTVTGYINGFEQVIAKTEMDVEDLEELLLDHNIEKCPNCEWYTDSFNLIDEGDDPDGYCDNCRKHDKLMEE